MPKMKKMKKMKKMRKTMKPMKTMKSKNVHPVECSAVTNADVYDHHNTDLLMSWCPRFH